MGLKFSVSFVLQVVALVVSPFLAREHVQEAAGATVLGILPRKALLRWSH